MGCHNSRFRASGVTRESCVDTGQLHRVLDFGPPEFVDQSLLDFRSFQ